MLTNRHVVVALLVAPVLSVLAWFAVGSLTGEQPQPALAGQSYPLLERSNCRYDSGRCELRNGEMQLSLVVEGSGRDRALLVSVNQRLDRVLVAAVRPGEQGAPLALAGSEDGRGWRLPMGTLPPADARLQVVAQADGSHWYADVSTAFLQRYRAASPAPHQSKE